MFDAVIIGGGAAGLMAACTVAEKFLNTGFSVAIVEKNKRPARKLMITGKGRCNVTNNCDLSSLITNTPRNGKFLYSAFSGFGTQDVMEFFENCGIPLKTERGNRVFPVSDKAVDIVDALVNRAENSGVKFICDTVREIVVNDSCVKGVCLSDGTVLETNAVILATGGMSYPLTGSTGDGYEMAKKLDINVTELSPSLIPLECHEGFCTRLAGLSLKNVNLAIYEDDKKKPIFSEQGEMLFTHFGISGPLVLSASAHIGKIGIKKYKAVIDLKPALSFEQLDKRVLRDFSGELNKSYINSLDNLLPRSIIPVVVSMSGITPDTKVNQISRIQRNEIINTIKNFTLHITKFRPIEEAIITSGGISVKEIEPGTMSSKKIKGLYFAGEIIDVDAYTGGFNLQIAFSTGHLAGKSVAEMVLNKEKIK